MTISALHTHALPLAAPKGPRHLFYTHTPPTPNTGTGERGHLSFIHRHKMYPFSYQQPTHRSAEVTQESSTKGLFNGLVEHSMCRSVCSHRCLFLHSSAFSRFAHSVPSDPMAAAMRQQSQALPEQLLLAEQGTQVWPPATEPAQHGVRGLWAQDRLLWQAGADSVTWKSSHCCHEPPAQHRQPTLCPQHAGVCPRVPASSPAAPRLPKQSWDITQLQPRSAQ